MVWLGLEMGRQIWTLVHVVAADIDALAVERHYQQLKATGPENILPLVFNIADPSPGLGWRGLERPSLDTLLYT